MSQIKEGDTLKLQKNKYDVGKKIGDGGFGSVFLGTRLSDKMKVAIKLFKSEAFANVAECKMYWDREVELTEAQDGYPGLHMHFIEAYQDKSDRQHPQFYIVLGHVEGKTLKSWFNDNLRSPEDQRMSVDDMIQKLFLPLCDYMDFAQKLGNVHRDFTFNNILITPNNEPVVIDWGGGRKYDVSKLNDEPPLIDDMEGSGTVIITPGFFAPEIIFQKPPLPQTDIYMFGAVLFYSLTNGYTRVKPTVKEDYVLHPQDYNINVSDTLNDIVEKCTQYEPRDRFRSFADISEKLQRHLGGEKDGLDQLPVVDQGNSFVLHILNNDAQISLDPSIMALEDQKSFRIGREIIVESAPWNENYKGLFLGITRCKDKNGNDRQREQFYVGYSRDNNLFYIHEGRNSNPTLISPMDGGLPVPLTPGQWTPVLVNQMISIKNTTVKGVFEVINVLDAK